METSEAGIRRESWRFLPGAALTWISWSRMARRYYGPMLHPLDVASRRGVDPMKCRYAFTKALLCMVSLAPMAQATAQEHDHHHAAAAVAAPAQRWTPDAPLREGMRRAHVAVEQLHRDETGRMSAAKVVE